MSTAQTASTIQDLRGWLGDPAARPRYREPSGADVLIIHPFAAGDQGQDAAGEGVFADPGHHVQAAWSVLGFAATRAGLYPSERDITGGAEAWEEFLGYLGGFPGASLTLDQKSKALQTSPDLTRVISDVWAAYRDGPPVTEAAVAGSVHQMAATVRTQRVRTPCRALFAQLSVIRSGTQVSIGAFQTVLRMDRDARGNTCCAGQYYTIDRTVFTVLPEVLTANARLLASRVWVRPARDWMTALSSKTT